MDSDKGGKRPSLIIWGWQWSWISLAIVAGGLIFLYTVGPNETKIQTDTVIKADSLEVDKP